MVLSQDEKKTSICTKLPSVISEIFDEKYVIRIPNFEVSFHPFDIDDCR